MARSILQMLSKALTDSFPAVKRSCAELLVMVSALSPLVAREHFKSILKALLVIQRGAPALQDPHPDTRSHR